MVRPADRSQRMCGGIPLYKLALLALLVGGALHVFVAYGHLFTISEIKRRKGVIDLFVSENPVKAALNYIGVMTSVIGFNVPGATMLSLSGGIFFKQPYAALYAYCGYLLGATMSYSIVRFIVADVARSYLAKNSEMFVRFQRGLEDSENFYQTVSFLIFIRYVAFFPFWFVNAACAVMNIGVGYFVLTTGVATIPGAAIYTITGRIMADALDQIDDENQSEMIRKLLFQAITEDRSAQAVVALLVFCAVLPVVIRLTKAPKDPKEEEPAGDCESPSVRASGRKSFGGPGEALMRRRQGAPAISQR